MRSQMPDLLDGRTPGLSTTAPVLSLNRRVEKPLSPVVPEKMHAYWRAASYLSIGQIYLYDNSLLKMR